MAAPSEPTSMNKTLGPVNPFHSPEREHLKKALRSGGIANFDVRKGVFTYLHWSCKALIERYST
jgi:hypothetical protein